MPKKKKGYKKNKKKFPDSQKIVSCSSEADGSHSHTDDDNSTDSEISNVEMETNHESSGHLKRKANESPSVTDEDPAGILSDGVTDNRNKKIRKEGNNSKDNTTNKTVAIPKTIRPEPTNHPLNTTQATSSESPVSQPSASININNISFIDSQPNIRKVHMTSTSEHHQLTSLNPCYLKRAIDKIIGEIESVQYLKSSGSLFINCKTLNQVKKLLETKILNIKEGPDIPIKVTVAKVSQTVQGKITAPEIADMSIAEILDELQGHGVVDVRKMFSSPDKREIPIYILTFFGTSCPEKIKFAYNSYRVDTYYPRVKICTKCCHYGHTKFVCRNSSVCHKCSSKEHTTEQCDAEQLKCFICKGLHTAFDKRCPADKN